MKKNAFAVRVIEIATAIIIIVVNFIVASCTDEKSEVMAKSTSIITPIEEDEERVAGYDFKITCDPKDEYVVHTGISTIEIFVKGNDEEPEKAMKRTLVSNINIDRTPDTVRVSAIGNEAQTNVSIARSFKNNKENDEVRISVSDGRTLVLPYEAEHASEKYLGVTYTHGHDSLMSAKLVGVKHTDKATRAAVANQYVKNTYDTEYSVEVTTAAYNGNGNLVGSHKDILKTSAITLVLADNNTTVNKTTVGEKPINDNQQLDSVVITKTWDDGHSEKMTFNTILNRSIKNIERREVIVGGFDGQIAGSSFSRIEGNENFVRSDANWTVYGREVVITKMVTVNGVSEEVRYTLYQERAEFNYEGVNHTFAYVNWGIENYADNFKAAMFSNKADYDELDYTNEIRTSYLGYVQMSNEVVAWYKAAVKISGYGVENAARVDYPTYTLVSLDKYAYYTDGTSKKVGSYNAKLPISVNPLTNWVLNETVWGVYTSDEFAGTQVGKVAKTAEKFFSYNNYTYNYANNVAAGAVNKFAVSVPNDIVFKDDDVEYAFNNSELVCEKKNENTALKAETAENTTYTYACVANVNFGGADQTVTLPGTINLAKDLRNHEHGKVVATYMTSTPNENRNYYYNVAVIAFEDGYRMVGMTNNDGTTFNFTMSSTKNSVNSAAYSKTAGKYVPAKAVDDTYARNMKWYDENGNKLQVLDYTSATAQRWNNTHNTVVDVRREGKISADGYSVTFYLNGIAGQTLNF